MGRCPDCGEEIDELVVSDTTMVASGIVHECPHCHVIVGISDATDI